MFRIVGQMDKHTEMVVTTLCCVMVPDSVNIQPICRLSGIPYIILLLRSFNEIDIQKVYLCESHPG